MPLPLLKFSLTVTEADYAQSEELRKTQKADGQNNPLAVAFRRFLEKRGNKFKLILGWTDALTFTDLSNRTFWYEEIFKTPITKENVPLTFRIVSRKEKILGDISFELCEKKV